MKYQYILDGQILLETNDVLEYITFIYDLEDQGQSKHAILYDLLVKADGHVCKMATKS